jgi:hypothetical protein
MLNTMAPCWIIVRNWWPVRLPSLPWPNSLAWRWPLSAPAMAVVELEAGKQHSSPLGTVHGWVLGAIADAAMGLAYATTLKEAETFATVELRSIFSALCGKDGSGPRGRWSAPVATWGWWNVT